MRKGSRLDASFLQGWLLSTIWVDVGEACCLLTSVAGQFGNLLCGRRTDR